MVTPIDHTLICGATRSGKSEAELVRLVTLAREGDCAIVLLDPPGTLAQKFLLQLELLGLTHRVIYDRLADTDRVLGYDWLTASKHPDPYQRRGENDERIREFTAVLVRRRGIQDTARRALIEEGLLAALRLYLYQPTPVPLYWLAEVFTPKSEARSHLLSHCTEPDIVRKFHEYAMLSPVARRTETGPAERILRAVCESPAFRVRSEGATFDERRFLDDKGILILDGSSQGNLSRDAAAVMMGAINLRVIKHCRTGARSKVVLVLDEAVNAGLIGLYESQALAEAAKWRLQFDIVVQNPFSFESEEIQQNVLQNCWRHEWFRQGSPEAARLAAEDIATPLLDPLRIHHTEYRTRTVDAGFERVHTDSRSESVDPSGYLLRRVTSWSTVLWPRRREVKDAQDRYTALQDQILLVQKELMLLRPGYRFVRGDMVTPGPDYVPLLKDPWSAPEDQDDPRPGIDIRGRGLREAKLQQVLETIKKRPTFRLPVSQGLPAQPSSKGAAGKLAGRVSPEPGSANSLFLHRTSPP